MKIKSSKHFVIIAGEESGDKHGAHLVNEIKKRDRHTTFSGIGGKKLEEAGVDIVYPSSLLSVVGLTEIFTSLSDILKGLSIIKKHIRRTLPQVLILIDFPDFNFFVASYAKKYNIKILYYISPQLWAWRSGRIKKIQRYVDQMAVILPFEEKFYKERGVNVTYVGHPLLDNTYTNSPHIEQHTDGTDQNNKDFRTDDEDYIYIGLLPGSRNKEINNLLPVMIQSAEQIKKMMNHVKFLIPVSNSVDQNNLTSIMKQYQKHTDIELIYNDLNHVFNKSSFLIATSGTVTLEAVIADVPLIIIYKMSKISYNLGKLIIHIENFGLPNLIAEEEVIPELLQDDVNPETISNLVIDFLSNKEKLVHMKDKFKLIRKRIGSSGASAKTAEIALKLSDKALD